MQQEIVIVDDSKTPLFVLNQKLSDIGYRTQAFLNPMDCHAGLDGLNPDLFILDIEMPGLNGIELCKAIKSKKHLSEVPVLFFSSADADKVLEDAFEAGGFDFLSKSVSARELGLRVRNAIEIARLRKLEQTRALTFEVLLRVVYHDLASPLMIAQHRVNSVTKALSDSALQEKLSGASRALSSVTTLTTDLRAFFAGQVIEGRADFSQLRQTIDFLFADRLADKQVEVKWTISDEMGPALAIPASFLCNQIVANFMSNALKFSFPSGQIHIHCQYTDGKGEISIEDFGPGMPASQVQALLAGGVQASTSGTKGEQGSGSGTMIAMFFLAWFKASLTIQSVERKAETGAGGTKVVLQIPVV